MVSNTPEYLVDEVLKQYGITVPLEKVIIYLEFDPYLTPETLFRYVMSEEGVIVGEDDEVFCNEEQRGEEVKIPNEKGFTVVDLATQNYYEIPLRSGCYIWLLKDSCSFPEPDGMVKPVFNVAQVRGKKYRVLYTGKAKSLHKRLNECHLNGNIARSTLRKSIAALKGFAFEHYLSGNTPKVKISHSQETQISNWLVNNCILMFKEYVDIDAMEQKLIKLLDPPMNIEDNPYEHNAVYVGQLKALRKTGGSIKSRSIGGADRNAGIESLWNSMGNAGKICTILGGLILFLIIVKSCVG